MMDSSAIANPLLKSKEKQVLIVGTTGVGKSTTINYINDIKLEAKLLDGRYKLSAVEGKSLEGGFKIGTSNAISETLYPGVYAPINQDFSYIDCPGFGDTRGMEIDI